MDDHYHTLSLRLYEVLDWVGASEEMRHKYRESSIVHEVVASIPNVSDDNQRLFYVLGSHGEGTTTTGLDSDIDLIGILCESVVETISDASPHGQSYLIVTDDTTKPGYCKLHSVLSRVAIYHPLVTNNDTSVPDQYGRMCLKHVHTITDTHREINGPAITSTGVIGEVDQDFVFALTCHNHIPSFASSWVTRVASCNRLNRAQINMLTEFGCFFVGKNHPSSQNGPIEWRLSFSLQERELMSSLNPTQHKCYILLKMIKKDILHQRVPESISSYHCKTCVLYAIEKTPFEFWTRRNLLECVLLCIKLLLHWVKENYCPNYFIPEENMFDRIEHRTLQQVQSVLEDMVTHWCAFIWSITCDDIGNVLSHVLSGCGSCIMRIQHNNVSTKAIILYLSINGEIRLSALLIHNRCNSISASSSILKLHSMQTQLLLTDSVGNHTEQETRHAIRYLLPHIRLQIAQCLAIIMLSTIDTRRLRVVFGWFKHYIEESKNCDIISAYLIIASYSLQSDRNDICENILLQCEMSLNSLVISVCGCNNDRPTYQNEPSNEFNIMLRSQNMPYTEFARTCTSGCLAFLPHQANLVPSALHYEMYRSVYTPPGSRDEQNNIWFGSMVVDSKVYMYFMQYVLYSKTNKPVYKQDAVANLLHVINTDPNLGHKETAYNLLGWIFKQENRIQRAMKCFLTSWRIRSIHNAAKWHLLDIIRSIYKFNSDRHML